MTKRAFFVPAALMALFCKDGKSQTAITASQVVCPSSLVPVLAVALPVPSAPAGSRMRIVCIPLDPASFVIDVSGPQPVLRFVGSSFADAETPRGAIDGNNTVFSLASAPNPAASLRLYRNGVRQQAGTDYTLSSTTVTFLSTPQVGDILLADYRH
jgi:hypothetical protein